MKPVYTAPTESAPAVLVPGLGRVADAAAGPTPHPLTTGEQIRYVAVPAGAIALLTFTVVLGMYKPGKRRRARCRMPHASPVATE